MKTKPIFNKNGFTLIELIVAMSLMLIVGTLGFITFVQVQKVFTLAEQTYIEKQAVRQTALILDSTLDTAFDVCIYRNLPTVDPPEGSVYIYSLPDGMYRQTNTKDGIQTARISEIPLIPTFSVPKDEANTDPTKSVYIKKALQYNISTTDKSYSINSVLYFPNMLGESDVNKPKGIYDKNSAYTGTVLVFTPTHDNMDLLLSTGMTNGNCFIATAAYGDYNQRPVQLLRRFRDDVLLTNSLGSKLVDTYYAISPPIANIIAQNKTLAALVRVLLIPFELIAVIIMTPQFLLVPLCFVPLPVYLFILYRRHRYSSKL